MHLLEKHAWLHRLLHDCIEKKDVSGGRHVQGLIKRSGLHSDPALGIHLIRLFSICGSLHEALLVFCGLPKSNAATWHAIISAHSKGGQSPTTLSLFCQMLNCHVEPYLRTFVCTLKACSTTSSLDQGMVIHAYIVENGFELNVFISSILIDMYNKCHRSDEAQQVFDGTPNKNVVSWTAMIAGHAHLGQGHAAMDLFEKMQQQELEPNIVTYVCVLKACSTLSSFHMGRLCHAQIMEGKHELMGDESICNTLIDMYGKCGSIEDARTLFDGAMNKSVVAWSAMMAAYNQVSDVEAVFFLFEQMQLDGIELSHVTYIIVLSACSTLEAQGKGRCVHTLILAGPHNYNMFVGNALVTMYAKCGSLSEARIVFDKLQKRDAVTWSAMIAGYAEQGNRTEVFSLFMQLQEDGLEPDKVMFGSLLKLCSKVANVDHGRFFHGFVVEYGYEAEEFLGGCLIDMYVKGGSVEDAHRVLLMLPKQSVVAWSALIQGYVQFLHSEEALSLFSQMQEDGLVPDNMTFVSILKACANRASLDGGKLVNGRTIQGSGEQNVFIVNTLIDLYVKCGRIKDAFEMFDQLGLYHVMAWSTMISGLSQHGHGQAALEMFQRMKQQGVEADTATYVCVLNACSRMAALEQGKLVHAQIKQVLCETDCLLGSTLIDMYSKCGSLIHAQTVFDRMTNRDVVAWSSIIAGYAENSNYQMARQYFDFMQAAGLKPNEVTYVSLLCACSNRGLTEEGCGHFESMKKDHEITPIQDHYNCLVDLFGRVGILKQAGDLLQTMPIVPSLMAWMSLLSHCRMHVRVELGRMCFENILMIDDSHASSYELMSKLYIDAGLFSEAAEVQKKRKRALAWKKVGRAYVEVNNKVSSFLAGGRGHVQHPDVCLTLQKVFMHIKEDGFIPLVDSVFESSVNSDDDMVSYELSEQLEVCAG